MILITGGLGFIGSHLSEALLNNDEKIILNNRTSQHENNYSELVKHPRANNMKVIISDIRDLHSLTDILKQNNIGTIYHLAALSSNILSTQDPHGYIDMNTSGVLNVLEAARRTEPSPRVVFASSSNVYGNQDPPLGEDLEPKPTNPYALSKYFGERLCHLYHVRYSISSIVLRYFNVIGERSRFMKMFADKISHDETPLVYGKKDSNGNSVPLQRDFVYVGDIVNGTISAVNCGMEHAIINLGTGKPMRNMDLVLLLIRRFGSNIKPSIIESDSSEPSVSFSDNSRAKKLLGWTPKISVQEIVNRYCNWYLQTP